MPFVYDGVDDATVFSTLSTALRNLGTGAYTIATLIKRTSGGAGSDWDPIFALKDTTTPATFDPQASAEFQSTSLVSCQVQGSNFNATHGIGAHANANLLVIISKPAGSAAFSVSIFRLDSGFWFHSTSTAGGNAAAVPATGGLQFGALGSDFLGGRQGVFAAWNVAMDQTQRMECGANLRSSDLANHSVGAPVCLIEFTTASPVDLMGGAGSIASNTAPTLDNSDTMGWDYDGLGRDLAETLEDDFTTLDTTTKWVVSNGTAVSSGGQLSLTPSFWSGAGTYTQVRSQAQYNLTASYAYAEVPAVSTGDASADTIFGVMIDDNNQLAFIQEGGNLILRSRSGGANSDTSIAYSSTTHRWWRISESGGTISWDTSPDRITWTSRRTLAAPFAVTAIKPYFEAGWWAGAPSLTNAFFDNLNTSGIPDRRAAQGRSGQGLSNFISLIAPANLGSGSSAAAAGSAAALTAASRLSGSSAAVGASSGALRASSLVSGSSPAAAAGTGALRAASQLGPSSTSAAATSAATVTFPPPQLSGTSPAATLTSGQLTASPRLSGSSGGVAGSAGGLTASSRLTGSTAAAGQSTGQVTATAQLTGTAAAAGTSTGSLRSIPQVTGASAAAAGSAAQLTAASRLSGTSVSAGSSAGQLTATGLLSGVSAAAAAGVAGVTASTRLVGSGPAVAVSSGNLTVPGPAILTGSSSATAGTDGALSASLRLQGSSGSSGASDALLTAAGRLAGASGASASSTGALGIPAVLSGSTAAVAGVSGLLRVIPVVSGTSSAVAAGLGDVSAAPQLSAVSFASAESAGAARVSVSLAGVSVGLAASSGGASVPQSLLGVSAANADSTGNLIVLPREFPTVPGGVVTGEAVSGGVAVAVTGRVEGPSRGRIT